MSFTGRFVKHKGMFHVWTEEGFLRTDWGLREEIGGVDIGAVCLHSEVWVFPSTCTFHVYKTQSLHPPTHTELCANWFYPPHQNWRVWASCADWQKWMDKRALEAGVHKLPGTQGNYGEALDFEQSKKLAHSYKEIWISKQRIPSWYWPVRKLMKRVNVPFLNE